MRSRRRPHAYTARILTRSPLLGATVLWPGEVARIPEISAYRQRPRGFRRRRRRLAGAGRRRPGLAVHADEAQAATPRLTPDGTHVAWVSSKDGSPEVYVAGLADGVSTRLTYWGTRWAQVSGWTPAGEVLAVSRANQPFGHYVWARALTTALSGSPGAERVLPFGPVSDLSLGTSGDGTRGDTPPPRAAGGHGRAAHRQMGRLRRRSGQLEALPRWHRRAPVGRPRDGHRHPVGRRNPGPVRARAGGPPASSPAR